jgi:murein DD-endopeptidase MepM/ murein hydrolase activator NlpD
MKKILAFSLFTWLFLFAGCNSYSNNGLSNQSASTLSSETQIQAPTQTQAQTQTQVQPSSKQSVFAIFPPVADAGTRITKKPFGIYITPKNSPVQPERFTGYHTGEDFETLPGEQNIDVPVYAICTGPLLLKELANGYGGVMVQQCTIADEAVTVIYGHIRLSSINFTKGEQISAGTQLGVLGTGYSTETDGERKHLHLGIHKGTSVNISGYVQNKADLGNWLDPQKYLPIVEQL